MINEPLLVIHLGVPTGKVAYSQSFLHHAGSTRQGHSLVISYTFGYFICFALSWQCSCAKNSIFVNKILISLVYKIMLRMYVNVYECVNESLYECICGSQQIEECLSFLSSCRVLTWICSPPLDDSAPPCHILSIMCLIATRKYQILIIKLQGPDSKGVCLLHAGLVGFGKIFVPQPNRIKLVCPLTNVEDVDSNMCSLMEDSTPPCEILPIVHPSATRVSKFHSSNPKALIQGLFVMDWLTMPKPLSLNHPGLRLASL